MTDILKRNNVRVIGEGEQVMMFAHGFGCDQNVWRHLIKVYQYKYTLVVFDFVGSGKSDLAAYDIERYSSLEGYAADVLDIIDALQLREVIFIGHSVSCMSGLRAAILKPQYFSKLVFVAPSPCYLNDGDYVGGLNREDLDSLFEMMDANYLGWSSSMAPLIMGNAHMPELGEELTANFCATDPDIARKFARVTFFSDNRADLAKLSVPSLTLQCLDDILAPVEVGYYLNKHTPNNTLVILEATGHCPHLSAHVQTIEAINGYLSNYSKSDARLLSNDIVAEDGL
ncbi:alpha/beta fold hydrolase [Mucilaginibacter galii]|uniref:Hydrolase n=1 Tax=Mucilaginibacter galii TaxID=2005073 RepID=A0A917J6B6_9SPHI|nr:alpha/beta hydrolase [Mucilaginibacter galii]GGI49479.1 hydrolase [Mucilaginibacter galii]